MRSAKTWATPALCCAALFAVVAWSTPTWAKSSRPHHHADSASHHHAGHRAERSARSGHGRHHHGLGHHRGVGRYAATSAEEVSPSRSGGGSLGSSRVVAEARRWIGTNPTGRRSLWCGRFMNFVLQRTGHRGTGSDLARSFAHLGSRVSGPQIGAIAVMARRGGGHVGVVSGIDANGNPIIISGNHGHRVAESTYARSHIYAYVMPQG